jgi:predicted NBD/HSP70 family sugar kinase
MFDAWLEDCANALVTPVLSMHALLDVPLVIVDGDLPRSALRRLISRLEGKLAAAKVESCVLPSLEMGNFGKFAGAIGAASLPLFINFNPRYGSPGGAVAGERKGQPQHGLWS